MMKILSKFSILILSFSLLSVTISAQMDSKEVDLEIHSRIVGSNQSDASFKTIGFNKSLFNIMLKKGQKGVIRTSINYTYTHLNYNSERRDNNFKEIDDFHSFGINISYFKRMNKKWSFSGMFNPQLSSNFTNKATIDDLHLNVKAIFNYSRKQTNRLSFGLVYHVTMGVPFAFPIISYWKMFNNKWQMTLGFPRMDISYSVNPKSTLSAYTEFDGYNANINGTIQDPFFGNIGAESINYVDVISGLEYQYQAEKFFLKLNVGYTTIRNFQLSDQYRSERFRFNMANNINIGIGMGFNL